MICCDNQLGHVVILLWDGFWVQKEVTSQLASGTGEGIPVGRTGCIFKGLAYSKVDVVAHLESFSTNC
jgi:hypothetical protein